jgi:flagellar motor switch protein FliG
MDRSTEKKIFDEMSETDPDLATEIRDRMFVFEDILSMDDRSIQRFIRECDTKDVVFALKTATEDMKTVFFNNMSKRMAETVTSDLQTANNIRLKDVEEAQQKIVNLIRKLEDQGELIISKGGGEDDIIV